MDLISLSPPDHRLSVQLKNAPGGFMWWYADAVDDDGNGFVLIWSWGLPFLPGYASAERRGMPQMPGDRPSLNLSVYKDGKLDFYTFQEFEPGEAKWDGDSVWQFGSNRMTSEEVDGRRVFTASIDLGVPGTDDRLTGSLTIDGVARIGNFDERPSMDHDWSPLTGPATSLMDLRFEDRRWRFDGRGYHDRNGGRVPMHQLPFDHWLWGRLPFGDRELIYYLFWEADGSEPLCLAMEIDENGHTTTHQNVQVERSERRRGLAGLSWHNQLKILVDGKTWLTVQHPNVLDDGPFYMRYQIRGQHGGASALGMAELCVPAQIDRDLHRPLVRMRVGQAHHDSNSMWLPLFTGPRSGRVQRLVRSWLKLA